MPLTDRIESCHPFSPRNPLPPPGTPKYNAILAGCGLNLPVYEQYGLYISNIFTLHWGDVSGNSCIGSSGGCTASSPTPVIIAAVTECGSPCPVLTLIGAWIPYTLQLALLSLVIIVVASLPLGTYSAVKRNRPLDQATRIFSFSGYALPGFLLASFIMLVAYFALTPSAPSCYHSQPLQIVWGNWPPGNLDGQTPNCLTPSGGFLPYMNNMGVTTPTHLPLLDAAIYAATHGAPAGAPADYWWSIVGSGFVRIFLPALGIAYGSIAGILRFVRNSMLEVMNMDYVRTARAKGVTERRVIRRHAGRNSLNATVTVLGLTFAFFLQGFAISEMVFELYGVGRLFTFALLPNIDPGVLTASTLVLTIMVVIANLMVDVLYGYLDPRVRLG
jgi:peptide/nickel transport system permease protein